MTVLWTANDLIPQCGTNLCFLFCLKNVDKCSQTICSCSCSQSGEARHTLACEQPEPFGEAPFLANQGTRLFLINRVTCGLFQTGVGSFLFFFVSFLPLNFVGLLLRLPQLFGNVLLASNSKWVNTYVIWILVLFCKTPIELKGCLSDCNCCTQHFAILPNQSIKLEKMYVQK